MKKHKMKWALHCPECWDKGIKNINDWYSSDEYYEQERQRALYSMAEQERLIHKFMHTDKKRADCEWCNL